MDLAIILLLSVLTAPLVFLASGPLRIALGLAFVLFFPGYTLIAALFPRKGDLDGVERLALSFGLSIAVVPLIGLILNYTPWGIRLEPIMISLLIFITVMSGISLYRRWKLNPGDRFDIEFKSGFLRLLPGWRSRGFADKLLTVLLVMAIVGAIGTLAYAFAKPKVGERFTEFYVLGSEGKAENYPRKLILGDKGAVLLGIVNQEHESVSYRAEMYIDGAKIGEVGPVALDHGKKWEQEITFVPTRAGTSQKLEFRLYKGMESAPYRTLHIWLDVLSKPG